MKVEDLQEKKLARIAKRLERIVRDNGYRSPDYTVKAEPHRFSIWVTIEVNHFIPNTPAGEKQFDLIVDDLLTLCAGSGELRCTMGNETYFGGVAAESLIKRGKTVNADALLSTAQVVLTFASNFK